MNKGINAGDFIVFPSKTGNTTFIRSMTFPATCTLPKYAEDSANHISLIRIFLLLYNKHLRYLCNLNHRKFDYASRDNMYLSVTVHLDGIFICSNERGFTVRLKITQDQPPYCDCTYRQAVGRERIKPQRIMVAIV